jgi:hypothetical protein
MLASEPLQSSSPPLRIHHFILAMTTMALVACWRLSLNAKLAEIPARFRSSNTLADILRISLTQTICYGGMSTVVIASLAWKVRHRTAGWQPGQWLAALAVADFLREIAFTLPRLISWPGPPQDGPTFTLPLRREFAYYLACAIVIGAVAIRANHGWVWRTALGVLAVQLLVYSLSNGALLASEVFHWDPPTVDHVFTYSIEAANYSRQAALSAIAVAALVNLIRTPRNSWTHWTGTVVWLAFGWSFEVARCLAM